MALNPSVNQEKIFQALDVDSTVQNISADKPVTIVRITAVNRDNAIRYIQLFPLAAASVVIGTTASAWVPVPPNGMIDFPFPYGVNYNGTALSIGATTTPDGAVSVTSQMYVTILYVDNF